MAERNPPSWLQAGTHPAEHDRLLTSGVVMSEGVCGSDLAVTFVSGLQTRVAAGAAFVAGDENAYQGTYHVVNDANKTLTHDAADATNGRIDIVVARVRDAGYSGSTNSFALEIVKGTAAATPAAPTTPSNALKLAEVTIQAGATSIGSTNVIDKRYPCVLRPTVVTGLNYPIPSAGVTVYRDTGTTTEGLECYNGSQWRPPWNLPWGEVGSATHTADVLITGTPTTVKTVGFIAVANRIYHITAHVSAQPNENDEGIQYLLKDGTTVLQTAYVVSRIAVYRDTVTMLYRGTFTAGSKTITLAAQNYYGNGGATVKASATEPVVVTVVDMGPAGSPT